MKSIVFWSFKIFGHDETDLHGGFYRVRIMHFANDYLEKHKSLIRGSVKNIKYKAEIEVRVVAETEKIAGEFKNNLDKELNGNRKEKLTFGNLYAGEEETEEEITDFKVIREDELTEMVWALQGAGGVFQDASKHLVIRDIMKERGLLGALNMEVGFIKSKIKTIIDNVDTTIEPKFNFEQHCLQKALVEPPFPDDIFMQLTNDLFYGINRRDKEPFQNLNKENKLKELNDLNLRTTEYLKAITERIQQLDIKLGKEIPATTDKDIKSKDDTN